MRIFICLLLAGITLAIYWPVGHFDFVHDDDQFFLTGSGVESGLNWHGLKWAVSAVVVSNWHPLTLLSFLLMHQFFGVDPGAEHLLNVLFHSGNAVLLFLVLLELTARHASPLPSSDRPLSASPRQAAREKMSGRQSVIGRIISGLRAAGSDLWKCAFAAALFAWHPLRVESVAWIAERKDVMFLFFMLLSIWFYTRYARRRDLECETDRSGGLVRLTKPSAAARKGTRSSLCYAASLLFFVLSLMSKAMVVTLPFLLLLLDFWPLQRIRLGRTLRPVCGMTTDMQAGTADRSRSRENSGSLMVAALIEKIPFFVLALVFCLVTFWVQKDTSAVASASELGWAPRLENATLSYVYYLGHFFWPANLSLFYEYPAGFNIVQVLLAGTLLAAITALCILEIRERPYLAVGWFWYLGTMVPVIGLVQVGIDAMADRYTYLPLIGPVISLVWLISEWFVQPQIPRQAGQPDTDERAVSVGTSGELSSDGSKRQAMRTVHRFNGRRSVFPGVLAVFILSVCAVATREQLKYWRNSVTLFNRAIAVAPGYPYPHFPLALGLEEQKRLREAATQFQYSLAMKMPRLFHPANYNFIYFLSDLHLSGLLAQMGLERQSDQYLEAALEVNPKATVAMNNLAWSLATSADASIRNGAKAVEIAKRACELTDYKQTVFIGTLAAAYAEAGQFDQAIATAHKAIANAQRLGETDLAQKNQELLQLYLAHKTYRQGE